MLRTRSRPYKRGIFFIVNYSIFTTGITDKSNGPVTQCTRKELHLQGPKTSGLQPGEPTTLLNACMFVSFMEQVTGFEPVVPSLATRCDTASPHLQIFSARRRD